MFIGVNWLRNLGKAGAHLRGPLSQSGQPFGWSLPLLAQGIAVLAGLALLTMASLHAWQERNGRLSEAQATNLNLARSLVQHAEEQIRTADAMLVSLVERFEHGSDRPEVLSAINRQMVGQITASSRVTGLFLYSGDGDWLASSLSAVQPGANNSDRGYFRYHRENSERGPYLGHAVRSRSRGMWILTVSRRLQHADGSFAGVVLATLDADQLSRDYARYDIGAKGTIALFRSDGTLLSRFPFDEAQIGRSFAGQGIFRHQVPESFSGGRQFMSPIDGIEKVAGYHSGQNFPLLINVASAVEDVLRGWAAETAAELTCIGVLALVIGLLGNRLARQVRRRQDTERALGESELHFRLLTEMSSDMVTRVGPEGLRRYVSPASTRLLGWTPVELLGTRALTTVHPEDQQAAQEELAALATATARDGTIAYRTRHRDGREVWIESSVRMMHDAETGAADGAVVISRDITTRKLLEKRLAMLAVTDGLTGLANRRHFDETLLTEWQRAAREGTAVSLALMDVDRFKQYNDRYGHQAGDECLRAIAATLSDVVRRPADLVARFGGEELVALLPNTEAQGAAVHAENMRAAIEHLEIAHLDSAPAGIVTVSIGVTSAMPMPDSDPKIGVQGLIALADEALYEAKKTGRNRVVARWPACTKVISGVPMPAHYGISAAPEIGCSEPSDVSMLHGLGERTQVTSAVERDAS